MGNLFSAHPHRSSEIDRESVTNGAFHVLVLLVVAFASLISLMLFIARTLQIKRHWKRNTQFPPLLITSWSCMLFYTLFAIFQLINYSNNRMDCSIWYPLTMSMFYIGRMAISNFLILRSRYIFEGSFMEFPQRTMQALVVGNCAIFLFLMISILSSTQSFELSVGGFCSVRFHAIHWIWTFVFYDVALSVAALLLFVSRSRVVTRIMRDQYRRRQERRSTIARDRGSSNNLPSITTPNHSNPPKGNTEITEHSVHTETREGSVTLSLGRVVLQATGSLVGKNRSPFRPTTISSAAERINYKQNKKMFQTFQKHIILGCLTVALCCGLWMAWLFFHNIPGFCYVIDTTCNSSFIYLIYSPKSKLHRKCCSCIHGLWTYKVKSDGLPFQHTTHLNRNNSNSSSSTPSVTSKGVYIGPPRFAIARSCTPDQSSDASTTPQMDPSHFIHKPPRTIKTIKLAHIADTPNFTNQMTSLSFTPHQTEDSGRNPNDSESASSGGGHTTETVLKSRRTVEIIPLAAGDNSLFTRDNNGKTDVTPPTETMP